MSHPTREPLERFWEKVIVGDIDDCWEWQGSRHSYGYGRFNTGGRGRIVSAHRYIMEVLNGPIPKELSVLHKCDNGPCVNPNHLYIGTPKQNNEDMVSRGRSTAREKNRHAKFTEDLILEMRTLRAGGMRCDAIMKQFNISRGHLSRILNMRGWKHLQGREV